jgi:hypothetical protein
MTRLMSTAKNSKRSLLMRATLESLLATLRSRYKRGWPKDRALTEPVHQNVGRMVIEYGGKLQTIAAYARRWGVSDHCDLANTRNGLVSGAGAALT